MIGQEEATTSSSNPPHEKGVPMRVPLSALGPMRWSTFAGMEEERMAGLRAQLDAYHTWPSEYMFKFIAPNQPDRIEAVLSLFPDDVEVKRKSSGGGKYVALTIVETVANADAVFDRYRSVSAIGGIFSL